MRYRISSLLALVVCAMTAAGHDSITAAAEWCRRATPQELAAFGLPYHPLLGRYRSRARRPCAASWDVWIPVRSARPATTTSGPCCPRSPVGRIR